MLINLVGNALKFTQRGRVDVLIAYSGDETQGNLEFEVSDTGIGISAYDQTVLFDRFKQGDSSRSRTHGGAGLGLSISQELVEIMDGSITVSSTPGVGSTFKFTVPVTCWQEQHENLDQKLSQLTTLQGRVLIAEDSETNAMVAKKMLDRIGLSYEHVTDGAAAVDAALTGTFDVVLMDVSMPILDGLEATRILRQRKFNGPIIAMTAHALKGDRDKALASGMSDYLTKPVRPQDLRNKLEEWIAKPAAPSPAPSSQQSGLNADAIHELWQGDLQTFAEIGKIFIDELSWRVPDLKNAERAEMEHHAHSLKGAASNVGATALSRLAAELETAAQSAPDWRLEELCTSIEAEAEVVRDAFEHGKYGAYVDG